MDPNILRRKLAAERYQFSIASDMSDFPIMVNDEDRYLEWRVDWLYAYKKDKYIPRAKLSVLPAQNKADFDRVYQEINKDNDPARVKVAECSKYASHAISVLLSDKKITSEYNVCMAGIGKYQNHNIVILIPKSASALGKGPYTMDNFPQGTLIVDPWAMAMGYGEDVSLAVEPQDYPYSHMLKKIKLSYQSVNDSLVTPAAVSSQSMDDFASRSGSVSPQTPSVSVSPLPSPPPIGAHPTIATESDHVRRSTSAPKPDVAAKPATAPKPDVAAKPATAPKTDVAAKPATAPKPDVAAKPATAPKPDVAAKPATAPKPDVAAKPATAPKPDAAKPMTTPPPATLATSKKQPVGRISSKKIASFEDAFLGTFRPAESSPASTVVSSTTRKRNELNEIKNAAASREEGLSNATSATETATPRRDRF